MGNPKIFGQAQVDLDDLTGSCLAEDLVLSDEDAHNETGEEKQSDSVSAADPAFLDEGRADSLSMDGSAKLSVDAADGSGDEEHNGQNEDIDAEQPVSDADHAPVGSGEAVIMSEELEEDLQPSSPLGDLPGFSKDGILEEAGDFAHDGSLASAFEVDDGKLLAAGSSESPEANEAFDEIAEQHEQLESVKEPALQPVDLPSPSSPKASVVSDEASHAEADDAENSQENGNVSAVDPAFLDEGRADSLSMDGSAKLSVDAADGSGGEEHNGQNEDIDAEQPLSDADHALVGAGEAVIMSEELEEDLQHSSPLGDLPGFSKDGILEEAGDFAHDGSLASAFEVDDGKLLAAGSSESPEANEAFDEIAEQHEQLESVKEPALQPVDLPSPSSPKASVVSDEASHVEADDAENGQENGNVSAVDPAFLDEGRADSLSMDGSAKLSVDAADGSGDEEHNGQNEDIDAEQPVSDADHALVGAGEAVIMSEELEEDLQPSSPLGDLPGFSKDGILEEAGDFAHDGSLASAFEVDDGKLLAAGSSESPEANEAFDEIAEQHEQLESVKEPALQPVDLPSPSSPKASVVSDEASHVEADDAENGQENGNVSAVDPAFLDEGRADSLSMDGSAKLSVDAADGSVDEEHNGQNEDIDAEQPVSDADHALVGAGEAVIMSEELEEDLQPSSPLGDLPGFSKDGILEEAGDFAHDGSLASAFEVDDGKLLAAGSSESPEANEAFDEIAEQHEQLESVKEPALQPVDLPSPSSPKASVVSDEASHVEADDAENGQENGNVSAVDPAFLDEGRADSLSMDGSAKLSVDAADGSVDEEHNGQNEDIDAEQPVSDADHALVGAGEAVIMSEELEEDLQPSSPLGDLPGFSKDGILEEAGDFAHDGSLASAFEVDDGKLLAAGSSESPEANEAFDEIAEQHEQLESVKEPALQPVDLPSPSSPKASVVSDEASHVEADDAENSQENGSVSAVDPAFLDEGCADSLSMDGSAKLSVDAADGSGDEEHNSQNEDIDAEQPVSYADHALVGAGEAVIMSEELEEDLQPSSPLGDLPGFSKDGILEEAGDFAHDGSLASAFEVDDGNLLAAGSSESPEANEAFDEIAEQHEQLESVKEPALQPVDLPSPSSPKASVVSDEASHVEADDAENSQENGSVSAVDPAFLDEGCADSLSMDGSAKLSVDAADGSGDEEHNSQNEDIDAEQPVSYADHALVGAGEAVIMSEELEEDLQPSSPLGDLPGFSKDGILEEAGDFAHDGSLASAFEVDDGNLLAAGSSESPEANEAFDEIAEQHEQLESVKEPALQPVDLPSPSSPKASVVSDEASHVEADDAENGQENGNVSAVDPAFLDEGRADSLSMDGSAKLSVDAADGSGDEERKDRKVEDFESADEPISVSDSFESADCVQAEPTEVEEVAMSCTMEEDCRGAPTVFVMFVFFSWILIGY